MTTDFRTALVLFCLLGSPSRCQSPSPMKQELPQAVLAIELNDPMLAAFKDDIYSQLVERALKQGMAIVPKGEADPKSAHHLELRISLTRAPGGNNRLTISGRAARLKDPRQETSTSPLPQMVWSWEQSVTVRGDVPLRKSTLEGPCDTVLLKLLHQAGLVASPKGSSTQKQVSSGFALAGSLPGEGNGGNRVVDFDFTQIKVRYQPPPPAYPPLAKIAGIQGVVVVEMLVDKDGLVEYATTVEGPPHLRDTAETYAIQWRFEPALLNKEPQKARFHLNLPFRLRGTEPIPIQRAALEVVVPDQELQDLIPLLKAHAGDLLKRIGVIQVEGPSANPELTHRVRIEASRPRAGSEALQLSVRCLPPVAVKAPSSGTSNSSALRTWSMYLLPNRFPGSLKEELQRGLREMMVPEIAPRVLPAQQP